MTALRKKTVVLVTHQVEFLSVVDKILVMCLIFINFYIYLSMQNGTSIKMKSAVQITGNGGRKNNSIRQL